MRGADNEFVRRDTWQARLLILDSLFYELRVKFRELIG